MEPIYTDHFSVTDIAVDCYGRLKPSMLLYLAVGTLGSLLCIVVSLFIEKRLQWLAKPAAWVGRHTLPILCLHLFVYSAAETVLRMLGILG